MQQNNVNTKKRYKELNFLKKGYNISYKNIRKVRLERKINQEKQANKQQQEQQKQKQAKKKKTQQEQKKRFFQRIFHKLFNCFYFKNLFIKHYQSTLWNDVIYHQSFLRKSKCFH